MRVREFPSSGLISPAQAAAKIAAMTPGASDGRSSGGRSISTGAPLRAGSIIPHSQERAFASPLFARSTTVRMTVSASTSMSCSNRALVLLRAPRGRPAGLPLCRLGRAFFYLLIAK
jgi:hypothetical protein